MEPIDVIKERRSINFFEPNVEIPPVKLKELIDLANLAPSSMNLQPWKLIVVKEKENKVKLRKCAYNQSKVEEASVVFIIIADPKALEENIDKALDSWVNLGYLKKDVRENYRKNAFAMYGEPESLERKLFAVKNSSLFAMNVMSAAKAMGLEAHAMDGFSEDAVKKEFNISKDKVIPMLIAIGYPKKTLQLLPRAFRRNMEDFVKVI